MLLVTTECVMTTLNLQTTMLVIGNGKNGGGENREGRCAEVEAVMLDAKSRQRIHEKEKETVTVRFVPE